MKRLFALLLLVLPTLMLAADSSPKITFSKVKHDFGTIEKGEKVNASFEFKNEGKGELEILDVKTSCGCTTAKPEKSKYAPGESGVIPVSFDSSRFTNEITKTITVTSNDPANGKTTLTIHGVVSTEIDVTPIMLSIYGIKRQEDTTREVTIKSTRISNLEITDVKCDLSWLQVKSESVGPQEFKISVTLAANKAPKDKIDFKGNLSFKTNGKKQKEINIPITIKIEQPIRVNPAFISFYNVPKGESRDMTIDVTPSNNEKFKILGAETDVPNLSVTVSQDQGKNVLKVKLSDKAAQGRFAGWVTVKTDLAEQPEIKIPVRGAIQ